MTVSPTTNLPITKEEYFKLQWTEASSAYKTIHDIVIKLISLILPLSVALSGFGLTNKSWLLLLLSAMVSIVLWILIFTTYSKLKVVWGALISYEDLMDPETSLPGIYTTFAKVNLGEKFIHDVKTAFLEKDTDKQFLQFKQLPSGYIGTPSIIIKTGLTILVVCNIILATIFYINKAPEKGTTTLTISSTGTPNGVR